jgi:CRISPR-associated protein Cas1
MNALLSFLYTLLTHDVVAACESVGLDPQMGFLHADRSGRASLALDLVEELRPMVADRLALSLVNRQQIDGKGFLCRESGAVEMNDATRKAVLVAYQKRKDEELLHPFLKEKLTVGLLPHVQARLLARWLREELDAYPPFLWK